MKNRVFTGLFIMIMSAPMLCAANISVLVIESGENKESAVSQYPILWENNLLEIFFDAGHIVSNSPKILIEGKVVDDIPAEAKLEFDDAKDGGMEYFLIALIDYSVPNVILRIIEIKSNKKVLEQKYAVTSLRNTKSEEDKIKAAIRVFAAQIR